MSKEWAMVYLPQIDGVKFVFYDDSQIYTSLIKFSVALNDLKEEFDKFDELSKKMLENFESLSDQFYMQPMSMDGGEALPIDLGQKVTLPCSCNNRPGTTRVWLVTLRLAIIHLNDKEKWTRHQIADWLETLDIDLRFGVKTDGPTGCSTIMGTDEYVMESKTETWDGFSIF